MVLVVTRVETSGTTVAMEVVVDMGEDTITTAVQDTVKLMEQTTLIIPPKAKYVRNGISW